ncbi:MAG: CRISPR-associated endonuclease Cas3'' [Thermomicrobiales bacterium]|nr:CRISPR-associated endonuclease Cas3'' [Thermomicrobiales bacterium]
MLYAHTPNDEGKWHTLACHSQAVAELAEEHAAAFGSGNAGWWAGILHDAGKASEEFQDYLKLCAAQPKKKHQTVDHKGAGFLRALELLPELAFLIQGHHGGLIDAEEMELKGTALAGRSGALQEALDRFDALGLIPADRAKPEMPESVHDDRHALEFCLRMPLPRWWMRITSILSDIISEGCGTAWERSRDSELWSSSKQIRPYSSTGFRQGRRQCQSIR